MIGLDISNETHFSDVLALPTVEVWGDAVGNLDVGTSSSPDGLANFVDIFAIISGFLGNPTAPFVWLELQGGGDPNNEPDFALINFVDIFDAVDAFQGGTYPFSDPCQCLGLAPCP